MSRKYIYTRKNNDGDGFYTSTGDGLYTSTQDSEYINPKQADKIYHSECDGNCGDCLNDYCPPVCDDCIDSSDCVDDYYEYSPTLENSEIYHGDMLTLPTYYQICFAIPCDLSLGSETARRIEAYFGIREKIENNLDEFDMIEDELEVGDVITVDNVNVLFTTRAKYQRPTYEDIRKCAERLAEHCFDNKVRFLAIPQIGCGHGHLEWNQVKDIFIEEFDKLYYACNEKIELPFISFCSL